MRPAALAAALALCLGATAAAQAPRQRILDVAEAAAFRAVGRLNVAGNRHCTATLIAPDVALTAAHCLFNPRTGRRAPPAEMKFVIGQWRDAYAALRGVAATAVPPDYVYDREVALGVVGADVALLRLDAPTAAEAAVPIPVGAIAAPGPYAIVAYGRDRAYAPSLREDCALVANDGAVVALDCAVTFGVSGAPVLAPGRSRVVAVVSAQGVDAAGRDIALAAALAPRLEPLLAALPPAPARADLESGGAASHIRPVRRPAGVGR